MDYDEWVTDFRVYAKGIRDYDELLDGGDPRPAKRQASMGHGEKSEQIKDGDDIWKDQPPRAAPKLRTVEERKIVSWLLTYFIPRSRYR